MIRLERIFCPTDLSTESDGALRYAIALARTYEAKLFVCHCVEGFADAVEQDSFARKFAELIKSHTGVAHSPPADCEGVLIEGDPATAMTRAAVEQRADLIVMRSRRRPLAAALLGSTAEAICHAAPCPVLVVHPDEREWVGATSGEIDLRRILVAHDFSTDSELAMQYGLSLAQEHQAELHLLHVLPVTLAPALTALPPAIEGDFQRAARMLEQAVPDEARLWCRVTQAVQAGQASHEILTYAGEHEIDLICLGVHGAGFTMRALFGSNADRVLREAPCPVLVARPSGTGDAREHQQE
ncbi:MAG TPA: universal stress protein [Blastocatellia bacterium]|nr:universal stress protein [Blastocatellia bacterium]